MVKPRLVVAAPRSGSGKTVITCALLQALKERKRKVDAFKCGPDYIDPMFHRNVLGVSSGNLDLFFLKEDELRSVFLAESKGDISVIEGVMGLYDGLGGVEEEASTYHVACTLAAPIVLVVDVHGMGRSVLAELAGFLSMDREQRICGVILNRTSKTLYDRLAPLIEKHCKLKVLGFFPKQKKLELDSRYLGLKLPDEIENLREKIRVAAGILEENVDIDCLLRLVYEKSAEWRWESPCEKETVPKRSSVNVRIGIAYDEVFCFYYRDNLRLLRDLGAELVFFSPLHDEKLPEPLDGILLGGGYPELMAQQLSENVSMRESIKMALRSGLPSMAECGGFMYLHESLQTTDGKSYPMVGIVHGSCMDKGRLVRFGYAEFTRTMDKMAVKGHEFHYFDSDNCGEDCQARKPNGAKGYSCMHASDNHWWGYGHLYYPSNPEVVKWFLQCCRREENVAAEGQLRDGRITGEKKSL